MSLVDRISEPAKKVLDPAAIDRRSGKPKRVPKAVKHAVRLILSGECSQIKAAAERVKLTREHLSKSLAMPHVQAFIARERAKIIGEGTMLAASRFVGLVDAKSEHVAAHVSERLLEQSGDLKPRNAGNSVNVSINNNIAPGYVIDLSGAATVDVTPSDKRSLANDDQPIDK